MQKVQPLSKKSITQNYNSRLDKHVGPVYIGKDLPKTFEDICV